jgi:hypothetical protein
MNETTAGNDHSSMRPDARMNRARGHLFRVYGPGRIRT